MQTVTVTLRALDAILSLPMWCEDNVCRLNVGSTLVVDGLRTRNDDNVDFIKLKYGDNAFWLRADLFDFDKEAYKAGLKEESKKRELERLAEKNERERKEILEHYDWNDLRCKAAVAAMQGFIINGIDDTGSKENNMKYLVSASVQVATALVEELKATV